MLPLIPIVIGAALGSGIGMATASGKKGSRGRGAWKGALAGASLGLGGGALGLFGKGATAAAGTSAPIASSTPAMSLLKGGVGNVAGQPLAASPNLLGKIGGMLQNKEGQNMVMQNLKQNMAGNLASKILGGDRQQEQQNPWVTEESSTPIMQGTPATMSAPVALTPQQIEAIRRYRDGLPATSGGY